MTTSDYSTVQIESTLPKPWEEEHSFSEVLYDWMGRAPWFAVSGAAHLLAFFVLTAIPWGAFHREEVPEIIGTIEKPAPDIVDEIEPEELPLIPEEAELVEDLDDMLLTESVDEISDQDDLAFDPVVGEVASPFESNLEAMSNEIGVGGPGGNGGDLGGGKGGNGGRGGVQMERSLHDALEWLKHHQSPEGYWDSDGFSDHCGGIGGSICEDPGYAQHDVGVTALALLTFIAADNTTNHGPYQEQVKRGIKWLRTMQDPDSGLVGEKSSKEFLYNHAIATLALCEAYYDNASPLLRITSQKAVNYIQMARNPYGAWRYDQPPIGASDTSVTGWMVFALKAAEDAKLDVDQGAFDGAMAWLNAVTDTASGRVGYSEYGNRSSRITGINDHYPADKGEAMTAVGLLCRIFMGESDLREDPILKKHGDLMMRSLPEWDDDGFGNDMYYWYYGTYAMFQLGGKYWKQWEASLKTTLLENQRKDGDAKGSWDPTGPWGFSGGRVYSTAMMALCIEVYFRYPNITGAR
jgi:hypothetical protein